jgi:hypothetical protein
MSTSVIPSSFVILDEVFWHETLLRYSVEAEALSQLRKEPTIKEFTSERASVKLHILRK